MVNSKNGTRDHGIIIYRYGLARTLVFSIGVLIIGGIFVVLERSQMLPDVPPLATVLVLIAYAFLLIFISVFISVFIEMRPEALVENEKQRVETIKAIEKIVESNDRFQAIFHGSNDAILIHEKETGRILEANQKAGEMFGYSLEEAGLIGINELSSGKPPYDEKHAVAFLKKATAGEAQIFEWQARHKTGQPFWVEVNLKKATIGAEDHVLATLRDITERKEAEEKREALIAELQEALDNIKTLKGLLPICSYCKKIRNDQGYWDNLELYIETHSDAQFSHGLCPECLDKLYGDQEWYIKKKKKSHKDELILKAPPYDSDFLQS